jgi:hypothetical protein
MTPSRRFGLGVGFYMQGERSLCTFKRLFNTDKRQWTKTKRIKEREAMTARELGQSSLEDSVHIGLLANKYQCSDIEQWTLKLINTKLTCTRMKTPEHNDSPASKQTLEYLVRTRKMPMGGTSQIKFAAIASGKLFPAGLSLPGSPIRGSAQRSA